MVSDHDSTLRIDGTCVVHYFLLVPYVFLIPRFYALVASGFCCPWWQMCHHGHVDGVVVNMLLLMLVYCSCMLAYILLHICHVSVLSIYAFSRDVIC